MSPPVRRTDQDYHFHAYDYAGAVAFTPGPAQPNRNNWRFYSMERDLDGLLQEGQNRGVPNIALASAGLTPYGRAISVLSFGNRANNPNPVNVTFTGGIHAREWIAPEIAYLIAEYLIINYTNNPQNRYAADIKALVDSRNIQIIPLQNPDGNDYTVFGVGATDGRAARYWRKNRMPSPTTGPQWVQALDPTGAGNPPPFQNVQQAANIATYDVTDYDPVHNIPPNAPAPGAALHRTMPNGCTGVDLNRNFNTLAWGYECQPVGRHSNWFPSSDTYFGPRRNSEPETQAIIWRLWINQPVIMIDYHSHGGYILYPSEAVYNGAVNADYVAVGLSLQALTRSQGGQYYQLGSPLQVINYDATGSITDHASQRHATRGVTIELDSGPPDPANQFAGFILPETMIRTVFERNIRGALATLAVPDNVSSPILVNNLLGWNVWGRGNRLPSA